MKKTMNIFDNPMQNPLSSDIYHRRKSQRKPDIRGDFFRDQTAIIHSSSFRRLKHKTQVFFSPENDHICTRIEHVLHVSTIATTICKGLGLDVELAQAIALGHDLGHAPFGHVGEHALNAMAKSLGGFIHEVHGLRVIDCISMNGKGLNLTYAVRDGIVSHCGEDFKKDIKPETVEKNLDQVTNRQSAPLTYEGCVVRVADKIAYLGRDIEDAITIGLITPRDIPADIKKNVGTTNGEIIDTLVMDVVNTSANKDTISFSDDQYDLILNLKEFNYQRIYKHPAILESDQTIINLLTHLYQHLSRRYHQSGTDLAEYLNSQYRVDRHFGQFLSKRIDLYMQDAHSERCVIDFVAGMTDSYALKAANEILFPKPLE